MSMKIIDFKNNETLRKFAEDADKQCNNNGKLDTQEEKSIFSAYATMVVAPKNYTDIVDEDILNKMKISASINLFIGGALATSFGLLAVLSGKQRAVMKILGESGVRSTVLQCVSSVLGLGMLGYTLSSGKILKNTHEQLNNVKDAKEAVQQ